MPPPASAFDNDSPAYVAYQAMLLKGDDPASLDRGVHRINYGKVGPNERIENTEGLQEEGETLELWVERYDEFSALIEGYTGRPISWVIRDQQTRERVKRSVLELKSILSKKNLHEGTTEYQQALAIGLFFFAWFAKPSAITAANRELLSRETKPLEAAGLGAFRTFLFREGGLGAGGMREDLPEEGTADQAILSGQGGDTEQAKILYAVFDMAGLKPTFVKVPSQQFENAVREDGNFLTLDAAGAEYFVVGLREGASWHLYDLPRIDPYPPYDDFFPLQLVHYLSAERRIRGDELQKQHRWGDALKEYREAIRLDPDAALPRNSLGLVFEVLGRSEAAEGLYREAIALEPGQPVGYGNLGALLADQKRYREALVLNRKAIGMMPRLAGAYYNMALILEELGRWEAAVDHFERARAYEFSAPRFHMYYGLALWKTNRKSDGRKELTAFLASIDKTLDDAPPSSTQIEELKNWVGNIMSRPATQDRELASLMAGIFLRWGDLYYFHSQFKEAEQFYRVATALDPSGRTESGLTAYLRLYQTLRIAGKREAAQQICIHYKRLTRDHGLACK